ncbi:MAG: T9SS type A sorting domain-containing protein, partial [Candidatus Cloacimonetes bacterium]|nr:T9SS type A sorting domain-containing protein [Candidatus Cloacimonadota bacterium]
FGGGGISMHDDRPVIFDPINRCSIYNNYSGIGQDIFFNYAEITCNVILDTFSVMQDDNYFATGRRQWDDMQPSFSFDILHNYYPLVNANLYVAPWGNDQNSGLSPSNPLQRVAYAMHCVASDSNNKYTVHCAPGVYNNSLNNQYFPIGAKSFVTLEGSLEEPTIFDMELNPRGFVYCQDEARYSTVRNFEWRNMNSTRLLSACSISHLNTCDPVVFENIKLENCTSEARVGFKVNNSNNVTFRNISMIDMTTYDTRCGISLSSCDNILVEDCTFTNLSSYYGSNSAFSAKYCESITLRNCSFDNCQALTSPYYLSVIDMTPDNTSIVANYVIENCLVTNCNNQGNGIVVNIDSRNGGHTTITGCTIVNNVGKTKFKGDVDISNCVFRSTLSEEIDCCYGTAFIDYCYIEGGQAGIVSSAPDYSTINFGTHNIDADPLFTGTGTHPYTLQSGSPCIDAGDPNASTTYPWDMAFNERVWDGDDDGNAVIDMGCYEYQPLLPPQNLTAQVNLTDVQLFWNEPQVSVRSLSGYDVYRDNLLIWDTDNPANTQINDINVEPGTHEYNVVAIYGELQSVPSIVNAVVDSASYQSPYNLTAQLSNGMVYLSWEHSQANLRLLTAYGVYRDSVQIEVIEALAHTYYLDTIENPGMCGYSVTAYYGDYQTAHSDTVWVTVKADDITQIPFETYLSNATPNPFNPETCINYGLSTPARVRIDIYNIKGQVVNHLMNEKIPAGHHKVIWRGNSDNGKKVASGVYFARLKSGNVNQIQKLILLK